MIKIRNILPVFIGIGLLACNGDDNKKVKKEPATLQELKGVWVEDGTPSVFNVTDEGVKFYQHTSETCALILDIPSITIAEAQVTNIYRYGTRRMSFVPAGSTEFSTQFFNKATLPKPCENAQQLTQFDPVFAANHIWHTLNDFYPFFPLRNVDWNERKEKYLTQVTENTTEEELFNIVSEMLTGLDDFHVSLSMNNGEESRYFTPGVNKGWNKVSESLILEEQDTFNDDEIETVFSNINLVFSSIFHEAFTEGPWQTTETLAFGDIPTMRWITLPGNIAYLQLNALYIDEDDNSPPLNNQEQLAFFHQTMENVMNDLGDTEGMILDLRFNGGGYDELALNLAGYFANREIKVADKFNYVESKLTQETRVKIIPNKELHYTQPVYVITGRDTGSAAEILTLAMRSLPHVTHIGEATAGALSDVFSIAPARGWNLGFSHQVYISSDRHIYEARGVPPHIEMPTSSYYGMRRFSAFPAISFALEQLDALPAVSQEEFEEQANEILTPLNIPGLAVAWLDKDETLETFTYGYADLASATEITQDTPFNIASVTKTFIGVALAQMIENNLVSLGTSWEELPTSWPVTVPYFDFNSIQIQDLATHSAGIIDPNSYFCGYYLENFRISLASTYLADFDFCPSPVANTQADFLYSLLNENGALYSNNTFASGEYIHKYRYSNIGVALLAEMMQAASGTSVDEWLNQGVFAPLGMTNTFWPNQALNEEQPKPATRYAYLDGNPLPLPEFDVVTFADGGLKSSIADMSRFLRMVINDGELDDQRILQTNSVVSMLSPLNSHRTEEGWTGMLWNNDGFMYGHSGGDPGAVARMRYDQFNELGFVYMYNINDILGTFDAEQLNRFHSQMRKLSALIYKRGLSLKAEKQ